MPGTRSDNEVLDSWKEIAVFLHRGVRTVQRWERTEGLPVRRHDHLKRGSVYALRSEVALWVRTRQFGHPAVTDPGRFSQRRQLREYIAEQRLLMNQLREELEVQMGNLMSSWKQLQLSAAQTHAHIPLLKELFPPSPAKSQAMRAAAPESRRASA